MDMVFANMKRTAGNFIEHADSLLSDFDGPNFYQSLFDCIIKEVPQTNAILIYMYDDKDCALKIERTWGLERDIRGTKSLSPADGVCGRVFSSASGELITESHQMQMFFKDIINFMDLIHSDENSRPLMPTSSVVVPIVSDSSPIGVLAAIEFSPQNMFSSPHLAFFTTIAKSLALRKKLERMQNENAFMHEEISLLENVLKRDSDQTVLAGVLSASMSALFLRGKEFDEMIELAAKHITFPVALYNMFLERLHCTENAISHTLPGNILDLIQLHGLIHKKDWQTLPQGNEFFCLIPIHFGGIMRGFLVAWIPSADLNPKDRTVLECLSFYLSFVWIKKAAVHEKNQNLKSEVLSGILSGKNDDSLLAKANALGLSGSNKFFVLMVAVPDVENHMVYSDKQECACLVYCIESILDKKQMSCIIVPEHNDICIIVSCKKSDCTNKRYDNIVNKIMREITEQQKDITISGSRIYDTIYNVRKCYWEAEQCLVIMKKYFIHRRCVNYIDIGVLRLLLTQNRDDVETYLEDILGPIIEYDKNRGTELIATLFYYSRFNKSIRYVSGKLNIHANTLYQRIRKVEELLGYDFENPMDWFDIQAASIMYGLIYTDLIKKI